MKIKIRKINKNEVSETAKLNKQLMIYESEIDEFTNPLTEKQLIRYLKRNHDSRNSIIVGAEDEGRIVGYLLIEIQSKKEWEKKQFALIYDAFVLPEYRRKGINKKMFDFAVKWIKSKKIKYIKVSVLVKNEAGMKAWKSLGFKEHEMYFIKKV